MKYEWRKTNTHQLSATTDELRSNYYYFLIKKYRLYIEMDKAVS